MPASDPPKALIAHRSKGRLRLKFPSLRYSEKTLDALEQAIGRFRGVLSVTASTATGSVLIVHESTHEAVLSEGAGLGLFSLDSADAEPSTIHGEVIKVFKDVNSRITSATGGSLNLGAFAFLALAGVGVYQISRGNFAAPAWYTAFWYAMNIFLKSKNGVE